MSNGIDFSSYSALAFRRDGHILHVTFNRPDTLNAFDETMESEFERFLIDIPGDQETRVIVLTGAGRAFSAGGDANQMQVAIDNPPFMYFSAVRAKRLVMLLLDIPQPIIAKVNGPAMGLGCTLALFSDLIYAANHAKIADPHVRVGYAAGDGGAVIWPQLIGYARAKEYLLTGDVLTGEEAAAIGLINHAVPAEQLDAVVDAMAQKLAQGARRAIQWTKATVNIGLKQLAASIMDAGMAYETLASRTEDHAEAVSAFRAKRSPHFTGN
ncbi:MAG: enoyl-CoA hydratase/isomerase family protein [Azonexus sp.]|nr:enoyl-CoA hydratase/isomerase family protein [Azonexus sp.]